MFHLLLGLLGLGGPLGLVTYLVGPAKVLAYAKGLPRWVWIAAAAGAAIVGFLIWHHHALSRHDKATRADQQRQDDTAWQKAFDKERQAAALWRRAAEANAAAISTRERKANDEENRRIDAGAADLQLRGPGKAAYAGCRPVGDAGLSAAASHPGAGDNRPPDATGALLPGDNGAAASAVVPWNWLVGRARQCDLDRAEALTWRDWYNAQAKAWEQMRQAAPKVAHP